MGRGPRGRLAVAAETPRVTNDCYNDMMTREKTTNHRRGYHGDAFGGHGHVTQCGNIHHRQQPRRVTRRQLGNTSYNALGKHVIRAPSWDDFFAAI